jgi:hexulose-6-phosphate isomerase
MEFARFCDECASPKIGLFFDTGNMVIFGYPEHWVRICGKHLMKVHFKDFKRPTEWTALLEGDVDFPAVMTELQKIGYDGALLSEVAPSIAPLEDTANAIRKIMEDAGCG